MSWNLYAAVLAIVGVERLLELLLAQRHRQWSLARGGVEFGQGHYPWMVALHASFLLACLVEAYWRQQPLAPGLWLSLLAVSILAQGLRWWTILTLKQQWNTRIIVVPGMPRVQHGPFRWLSHPNYLAVILEIAVLPLLGGAWLTAILYSLANAWLLTVRVRAENAALEQLYGAATREANGATA